MREGEEREWVRVERRRRRSERNPVRHILPRRGESRYGEAHRIGRAEEHGFIKMDSRDEGQVVRTFLVMNFPPDCSPGELVSICREAGTVVDLFCPKKLDVKGKRFCFVRIAWTKMEEEYETLAILNNLWIDSYKLRAFIPLYGRREQEKKDSSQGLKNGEDAEKPHRDDKAVAGTTEETQAAMGCKCTCTEKNSSSWKATFVLDPAESNWLVKAQVGRLKQEFTLEENKDDIQEEAQGKFEVKSIGEDLILIQPLVEEEGAQERMVEWGSYWCRWVKPWKHSYVSKKRDAWTSWFGVPLHAWSERFFKQISLRFGVFLDWDSNTQRKTNLDRARIKIRSHSHKLINETVTIAIDRLDFPVTIIEESFREEEPEGIYDSDSSAESDEFFGDNLWLGSGQAPEGALENGKISAGVVDRHEGVEVIIAGGGARVEEKGEESRSVNNKPDVDCYKEPQPQQDLGGPLDSNLFSLLDKPLTTDGGHFAPSLSRSPPRRPTIEEEVTKESGYFNKQCHSGPAHSGRAEPFQIRATLFLFSQDGAQSHCSRKILTTRL